MRPACRPIVPLLLALAVPLHAQGESPTLLLQEAAYEFFDVVSET